MAIEKLKPGPTGNYDDLVRGSISGFVDASRGAVNQPPLIPGTTNIATIVSGLTAKTLPKEWNRKSVSFSNLGGTIVDAGTSYPDNFFITSLGTISYGTGTQGGPKYVRSFYFYGDKFEMYYKEANGECTVMINSEVAGSFSTPLTGSLRYFSVELPSVSLVRVDILCNNQITGDVYTAEEHTIYATKSSKKVLVAGDSYTEGVGSPRNEGFVDNLMKLTGNYNIVNSGLGGTGYLKENNGRPNLMSRVSIDVIKQKPDVLVVAMGINDPDSDELSDAIDSTFDSIKRGIPDAKVIVLGSWTSGNPSLAMISKTKKIKEKAEKFNFSFIDPTGKQDLDGWFTGTGNSSSPAGDGNADLFISSDGVHPNTDGHLYIAARLLQELLDLDVVI